MPRPSATKPPRAKLRLVKPGKVSFRDKLKSLGWRIANLSGGQVDADLWDVLHACRDPELTAKMAAVAREHWEKDRTQPKFYERLIAHLDQWDDSEEDVSNVANMLFDAFDIEMDEKTGAVGRRARTRAEFETLCKVLLASERNGEARLRKALGFFLGNGKRADAHLKFLTVRARRKDRS